MGLNSVPGSSKGRFHSFSNLHPGIGRVINNHPTNLDVIGCGGRNMNLTNESYVIKISSKSFFELYYKDSSGWVKVSARGRKFRATAEQVLNHVLPALAGIKPNVNIQVEHYDDPETRFLEGSAK
jgi:hypothetical protein